MLPLKSPAAGGRATCEHRDVWADDVWMRPPGVCEPPRACFRAARENCAAAAASAAVARHMCVLLVGGPTRVCTIPMPARISRAPPTSSVVDRPKETRRRRREPPSGRRAMRAGMR